ncbi:MAG: hypothetical protein KDB21_09310 [Acidimicrobiales bacterium]|nr:hypothetical protein [Acidimicrobiales bacterium]
MTTGSCSGRSNLCEASLALIAQALEGVPSIHTIEEARQRLASCPNCAHTLEVQIRFKMAMGQACRTQAPESLQIRISSTLRRIDLGELDIGDL